MGMPKPNVILTQTDRIKCFFREMLSQRNTWDISDALEDPELGTSASRLFIDEMYENTVSWTHYDNCVLYVTSEFGYLVYLDPVDGAYTINRFDFLNGRKQYATSFADQLVKIGREWLATTELRNKRSYY